MIEQSDPQTYAIIGAAMEVHRTLGRGFLELVYHAALAAEFTMRSIPFIHEAPLSVMYKGELLPCNFRADFICYGTVIIELKAQLQLSAVDDAQVINYLKASKLPTALLMNFGAGSLQHKRFALSKDATSTQH